MPALHPESAGSPHTQAQVGEAAGGGEEKRGLINKPGLCSLGLGAGGLWPEGRPRRFPQLPSSHGPASPSSSEDTLFLLPYQQRRTAEQLSSSVRLTHFGVPSLTPSTHPLP